MTRQNQSLLLLLLALAILVMLSCSAKFGIDHYDRPEESGTVEIKKDGTALIRSLYSDIALRHMQDSEWEELMEFPPFKTSTEKYVQYRVPRLKFFMISVKNTWEHPVTVEDIVLSYNGTTQSCMDAEAIAKTFKSPSLTLFNFKEILGPRRLMKDSESLGNLNMEKDTIKYEIAYIPPSDRLFRIIAFRNVPAGIREYRIIFHLNYMGTKKIIAFDLRRFEYRTQGTHFVETHKAPEELPE